MKSPQPTLEFLGVRMPHVDTPQSLCRVGVARCDITPPVGIYHRMWGAAKHDQSTGVHRPLTATAIAMQAAPDELRDNVDAEHGLVIIGVDHCLLWGREMAQILAQVAAAAELPAERVMICF